MYKLMIVEDEPIEREALKMMVQANCKMISTIEEAENGFEAIKKCKTVHPNIVIVDLNMPGINGLDTIKELQKSDSSIRFLILSAYNRFEFAQEAIKLGVEDFIVKPAKISDIKKSLDIIIHKMEQTNTTTEKNTALLERMEEIRPILENDCIHAIVSQKNKEDLQKLLSFLDFQIESGFCFGVSYENSPRILLNSIKNAFEGMGITCIGEQFHNLLIFFILDLFPLEERRRNEVGRFIKMLLKEENRTNSQIGIGNIYNSCESLYLSYQEAIMALENNSSKEAILSFYNADSKREDQKTININFMANQVIEIIQKKEIRSAKECITWITTELFIKRNEFSKSKESLYQLMAVISSKIQSIYPDIDLVFTLPLDSILKSCTNQEAETYCSLQIHNFQNSIEQYKQINQNMIVKRALSYIDNNYEKSISLNDMAEELHISIFYLSKILKKHTGKNFTDILAEKRINIAKNLLNKNLSIKEITYQVGFNSQNYFTKVFKKYAGCTPRDYKQ